MIRVRNESSRPCVRFNCGVITELSVESDGWTSHYPTPGASDHHTGGELGHERGRGGFSPVFVYPEDGLAIESEIVPGEETLLRSSRHNRRMGSAWSRGNDLIRQGRAFKVTRIDDAGSVWGILDEWDVLFIVRDARGIT